MELKTYQKRVIGDLTRYLDVLATANNLPEAFKDFWQARGVFADAYKNVVPGVPHVCVKVPTAGGKTFIAVNALDTIFKAFEAQSPQRTKFVVWLVPSLTILEQTYANLANPEHDYRKRLNQLFKNRVAVYQKADLLTGAGFSADTVQEQLSIVVMSFDSLRTNTRNREDRKIYQENGYLASFETSDLLDGTDATALINVLRTLKPVVIVDESHNAESTLSVEMLNNLNPDFILDLTATPRQNSNIISFVDAMALKKQHMVKLPVIVANRDKRSEVIESALLLRRNLEQIAIAQEAQGGRYIRPIVLFQAQPRTGEENTTFDKVKQALLDAGIPPNQIAIKTADRNELKNVDLMSRDCPVRFIITVNALKEGWDCPFAYILASLADKTSSVDVEQILGRVLRMPHVQQHGHALLNTSYVFTASSKFAETLQSIVAALNRAGFSRNDFRTAEPQPSLDTPVPPAQQALTELASQGGQDGAQEGAGDVEDDMQGVSASWSTETAPATAFVNQLQQTAQTASDAYDKAAQAASDDALPAELEAKTNMHKMLEIHRADALAIKLPQFFVKVETGGWFDGDDQLQLLERDGLLKHFKLSMADATVKFEAVDTAMYRVDLAQEGAGDYAPKPFKLSAQDRQRFASYILGRPRDKQIADVAFRLAQRIGNMFPIADTEVLAYVKRIVAEMDEEQIKDAVENEVGYGRQIREKIRLLADAHAESVFNTEFDVDALYLQPSFALPESIIPSSNAPELPKTLYQREGRIGTFEATMIEKIADLPNVVWWHRNLSRGHGFRINGFLNHYPDFIVRTATRVLVVEAKGDDRDNTDSAKKLRLGKKWEAKAGNGFRYMMVFENNAMDGADNLPGALAKIARL